MVFETGALVARYCLAALLGLVVHSCLPANRVFYCESAHTTMAAGQRCNYRVEFSTRRNLERMRV
jgi:hypothetical protein